MWPGAAVLEAQDEAEGPVALGGPRLCSTHNCRSLLRKYLRGDPFPPV